MGMEKKKDTEALLGFCLAQSYAFYKESTFIQMLN